MEQLRQSSNINACEAQLGPSISTTATQSLFKYSNNKLRNFKKVTKFSAYAAILLFCNFSAQAQISGVPGINNPPAAASTPSANIGTTLTFSGSTRSTFNFGNCFYSNEFVPALTTSVRVSIVGTIRRPSATGVGIGIINSSGLGFTQFWQSDNNLVFSRVDAGSTTSKLTSGGTVSLLNPTWSVFRLAIVGDQGAQGPNFQPELKGFSVLGNVADNTYTLSAASTWQVCVYAAGITSADLGVVSIVVGAQP